VSGTPKATRGAPTTLCRTCGRPDEVRATRPRVAERTVFDIQDSHRFLRENAFPGRLMDILDIQGYSGQSPFSATKRVSRTPYFIAIERRMPCRPQNGDSRKSGLPGPGACTFDSVASTDSLPRALRPCCSVEKIFPWGGPDCVGVAEGDKRRANNPLAACGRPDAVRATQPRTAEQTIFNKGMQCRFRPKNEKVGGVFGWRG